MYRVKQKINNKSKVIQKEKLLTIGIITKNESEKLERCLKSLMPIREALDCEIIVTDTGSTDNTVEIAQKYADQVLHFEWCDDFSAARNTGIDAAKGLWFMWIDSDEWIENPDSMIDFFNSGKYKNYATANVNFVNIIDYKKNNNIHIILCRLMLLNTGRRFTGNIHEHISLVEPVYNIKIMLYHDGYAFKDLEDKNDKHDRNMELLLRSHEEKPDDLSIIRYIAVQYRIAGEYEAASRYCDESLRILDSKNIINHIDKAYKVYFSILQASNYYETKRYEDSIQLLKDMQDDDVKLSSRFMDVYAILFASYSKLGNTNKAFEYCEKYLDYYSRKNDFDKTYSPVFFHLYEREEISRTAINYYIENLSAFDYDEISKFKPVERIMNISRINIEFNRNDSTKNFIADMFKLAEKIDSIDPVMYAYRKLMENKEDGFVKTFQNRLSRYVLLNQKKAVEISEELLKLEDIWNLGKLVEVFSMDAYLEKEKLHKVLLEMLNNEDNEISIKSELLYRAVKSGIEFRLFADNTDLFLSGSTAKLSIVKHEDLCENIIEYYHNMKHTNSNIRFMYFITSMIESSLHENLSEEVLKDVYDIFSETLPVIIRSMYNPDIMTEENISIYPPVFRFGYYIERSRKSRESGDLTAYARELKKAVRQYPVMGIPIKSKISELEKELEERDNQQKEFEKLAAGVKQKIYELLDSGNKNEALAVISQLQAILPEDEELKELFLKSKKI